MARTGPVTKDTSTVALGLAKIMLGVSATHIDDITAQLSETTDSLGALNSSSFTSNVEYWKLESGFPMLEDMTIPLRESAMLECEFKEIQTKNLAYARGIDASSGYGTNHSGSISLGTMAAPAFVRAEAVYTYPNATNKMIIIFPRANVTSSVNLNFASEDNVNVPITIEAKRSDDEVVGGNAVWNNMPLGRIYFT